MSLPTNNQSALDFTIKADISNSCRELNAIIESGIFSQTNIQNPLLKASFAYTLVLLRDLICKANKYGSTKVNFTDDIRINNTIKNIDDLIKYVRDALCHLNSPNHYIENNIKFSFNVAFGKANVAKIGDLELNSLYEDDICFFFGSQKIYLNRHILRAFNEAKKSLESYIIF